MSHVRGLLTNPDHEMHAIAEENESVSHCYCHHVLLLAAIPVVSAFIGTTHHGWDFGGKTIVHSQSTAAILGAAFYVAILAAVILMGKVIHWLARGYPQRPGLRRCVVFAAYIATPMFISGLVALYPVVWVCIVVGAAALFYSGYLLYLAVPCFLNISKEEGLRVTGSIFAIGVLVLELLLMASVAIWGYGDRLF